MHKIVIEILLVSILLPCMNYVHVHTSIASRRTMKSVNIERDYLKSFNCLFKKKI